MTQTDTIAREHPLNEVEAWQRAAARWEERLTVDPFAAGPFRSCLMRLMVAERNPGACRVRPHQQRPDLAPLRPKLPPKRHTPTEE